MSDEIRLEIPGEMSDAIKQTKINIEYEKSQIDTSFSDDETKTIINSLINMDQLYCVIKPTGNIIVAIIPSRQDSKFHFVNLTKGHICECGFDSVEDAIKDMESLKGKKLITYFKI